MPTTTPIKLAVLISGSGTTLKNLLLAIANEQLTAEVSLVIASRPDAGGLAHADEANIARQVVRRRDHSSPEEFAAANFDLCRQAGVDVVVMGGYLQHLLIPADFKNRVLNIHPSLIPSFCGKGFYGQRVHQAVLDYGAKISGCTVHYVDDQYDHGPIILQRTVAVAEGDTPQTLAARIFEQECDAYPAAIQAIAEGRVRVEGRIVRIR